MEAINAKWHFTTTSGGPEQVAKRASLNSPATWFLPRIFFAHPSHGKLSDKGTDKYFNPNNCEYFQTLTR